MNPELNAVQMMEGSLKIVYVYGGQANRLAGVKQTELVLVFRQRHHGLLYGTREAAIELRTK